MKIKKPRRVVFFAACLLLSSALVAENGLADDYAQFAIDQQSKPFDLDCATKHAKYFEAEPGETTLASIKDDDAVFGGHSQTRSRSGYSRKLVSYQAPSVPLVADDRSTVRFDELMDTDKPVMLNFIFTTCTTICPVLSASFKQVQDLMGDEAKEIMMVSITIDPEYDTPEKLAEYSKRYSAGGQWRFLTGQIDDVIAVEKAFDIFRGSKTNHEPVTFMRSGKRADWLRIEGFANASEIVSEYHSLSHERLSAASLSGSPEL